MKMSLEIEKQETFSAKSDHDDSTSVETNNGVIADKVELTLRSNVTVDIKEEEVVEASDSGVSVESDVWNSADNEIDKKTWMTMPQLDNKLQEIMDEEENANSSKGKSWNKNRKKKKGGGFTKVKSESEIVKEETKCAKTTVSASILKSVSKDSISTSKKVGFEEEVQEDADSEMSNCDSSDNEKKKQDFAGVKQDFTNESWDEEPVPDDVVSEPIVHPESKRAIIERKRNIAKELYIDRDLKFVEIKGVVYLKNCAMVVRDKQVVLVLAREALIKTYPIAYTNSLIDCMGRKFKIRRISAYDSNVTCIDVFGGARNWFQKIAFDKTGTIERFDGLINETPFSLGVEFKYGKFFFRVGSHNFVWPDVTMTVEWMEGSTGNSTVSLNTTVDDWLGSGNMAIGTIELMGLRVFFAPGVKIGECYSNVMMPVKDVGIKKYNSNHVVGKIITQKGNVVLKTIEKGNVEGKLFVTEECKVGELPLIISKRGRFSLQHKSVKLFADGRPTDKISDELCVDHLDKKFSWRVYSRKDNE